MKHLFPLAAIAAAALTACGGGGSDGDSENTSQRGNLREPPATVATLSAAQIDATTTASGLIGLSGPARCDVKVVTLNYDTVGVKGEGANASGALLVPTGACAGSTAPLLVYAHGSQLSRQVTMANPQDTTTETSLLIAMYAAQGYAVVATDYLGYAKSTYSFHPYLHADSEASAVIDSIRAARKAADQAGAKLSGKIMLAGYSQGGHSAAATQRAIERDNAKEFNLVAAAAMAGPYNLSGAVQSPEAALDYQFFVPFLLSSWQKVYGNIYKKPSDAYKQPYADYIEDLLPSPTLDKTTLVTSGRLPGANGETPNQVRDLLIKPAFLADSMTNPDSGVRVDARRNDMLGWTPKAPLMLCAGSADPVVPFALHQAVLKADFDQRGVKNVSFVDIDPQIQALFGPGGKAPAPGSLEFNTYYGSYHDYYGPPLCFRSAREMFDRVK